MRNKIESNLRAASYVILAVSAAMAIWAMTRGLEKPLLGPHSFRQTQTAISTAEMAANPAIFFDYPTPVLGKPWRIPMELPVYQWVVARFHNLSGIGLDISGKLISIAAWILCLVPLLSIGRSLEFPREILALTAAIALASPLYLFWGAAFLIETTGLLFGLCMVACVLRARKSFSWKWLLLAVIAGSLAATVKATTWAVAAGTGLLLVLLIDGIPRLAGWKKIVLPAASLLVPLIPGKLWLAHGDSVKQANPFAREIILASSAKQAAWNFGTWDQKLDPATWQVIPFPGPQLDQFFAKEPSRNNITQPARPFAAIRRCSSVTEALAMLLRRALAGGKKSSHFVSCYFWTAPKLAPEEAVGAIVVNPRLLEGQNQAFWNSFFQEKDRSVISCPLAFLQP